MADEQNETQSAPNEVQEQPEPTVEEIQDDRRAAKDRARRERLSEENKTLKAELAEIRQRDEKAELERQRKAGDYEKLEAKLQTDLRGKEERIAELEAKIEASAVAERRSAFVDAVVKHGGVTNRRVAAAVLKTLDIDSAPENFTERDAKNAAKLLQKEAPEIFGAGSDTPKPPPGGGKPTLDRNSPEYWNEYGRRLTTGGPGNAYLRTVGRAPKE